jgi:sirohydrochlorin ferrochelatase
MGSSDTSASGTSVSPDTTVVLVAHGSRNRQANDEVAELCREWSAASGIEILPAFLELAEPSISQRLEDVDAAAAPGTRVIVVPYLLLPGNHTQRDIPEIVADCQLRSTRITIELSTHLGAAPPVRAAMLSALTQLATEGR